MDTEEHLEIQHARRNGHPQTDEGPYYHESWWESYKGSVKGKLGGVIIGALMGAIIGVAAAGILAVTGGITLAVGATVAAGFAAAGMLYGAHEFSDVGKVTGAVAAAHEKSEQRMKSFENGKFAEVKKEIRDIKNMISGKKPTPAEEEKQKNDDKLAASNAESPEYRTQHCDDHCAPKDRKWVFWNVAGIGAIIGVLAGALLGFGGVSEHIMHALGGAAEPLAHGVGAYLAPMAALGLFGASFGINRDMFRKVFDNTDLWFKGIFNEGKSRDPNIALAKAPCAEKPPERADSPVTTIVYDSFNYPQSDTYHRDKVLASAKQALLSMDHTKAVPH